MVLPKDLNMCQTAGLDWGIPTIVFQWKHNDCFPYAYHMLDYESAPKDIK